MNRSRPVKIHKKSAFSALILALLLYCSAALPVMAFDPDQSVSLTVAYSAVESADFRLCRVASVDGSAQLHYLPAYEAFTEILDVTDADILNALTSETMIEAAGKMSAQIPADGADVYFNTTDHRALVTDLVPGLYVLAGDDVATDRCIYHALPILVMLPQFDYETGAFQMSGVVEVKPVMEEIPTPTPTETPTPTPTSTPTPTPTERITPTPEDEEYYEEESGRRTRTSTEADDDQDITEEEFNSMRTYNGDTPPGGKEVRYKDKNGREWVIVYDKDGRVLGKRPATRTDAVRTGDDTKTLLWALIMAAAFAGLVWTGLKKRAK